MGEQIFDFPFACLYGSILSVGCVENNLKLICTNKSMCSKSKRFKKKANMLYWSLYYYRLCRIQSGFAPINSHYNDIYNEHINRVSQWTAVYKLLCKTRSASKRQLWTIESQSSYSIVAKIECNEKRKKDKKYQQSTERMQWPL